METKFFYGDEFLYGASVAPYAKSTDWAMDEWENDIITMKSLNFNISRIFIAQDRIELREGEYDWTKPDYYLDIARKHGLKVIANAGGVFRIETNEPFDLNQAITMEPLDVIPLVRPKA